MAYDTFTAILSAKDFPFVSDFFQRSVIVPGLDQPPRIPRALLGDVDTSNAELAQHYYGQNVMPTTEGLMSIGFMQVTPGIPGAIDFDQVITLRDADENNFLFSPAAGKNYIYTANNGVWKSISPFTGANNLLVSRAYVNGRTFICYQRNSIREFDNTAQTFDVVPFTFPPGMSINDIDCIGSSNNYLLWASNITIGWSSLIDPTNLVPDIQTGAGLAIPQDIKGPARAIVPTAGGFLIYTTKNVVAAMFTNNARAPFVFREVSGAGGVEGPEQISTDAGLKEQYAWTSAGMQKINLNAVENVDAAATDFIAGRIYESFDISSLTLTTKRLNSDLEVKVAFISNRFLVISYGENTGAPVQIYTHALILDTSLKRWGKIRLDHTDCLLYPYPNLIGEVTQSPAKRSLAFLQLDGTIQLLVMDYRIKQDQGVLLLGKYQLSRQRMMTFQTVIFEDKMLAYPPTLYLLLSPNGRDNNPPLQLKVLESSPSYVKYGAPTSNDGSSGAPSRTGTNFSILAVGKFEFSTALFNTTRHGQR